VSADAIRATAEALAGLERLPCSPGEREAAGWLAARLRAAGCADVREEEEVARGRYLDTLAGLGLAAAAAALLTGRGHRAPGAALAVLAAAALVDEAQGGPRLLRRAVRRPGRTVNVVATAPGPPVARRTLVVLAHHDAHPTGALYDQTLQRLAFRLAPRLLGRVRTGFPQWWLGLAGPALTLAAAMTGRRGPARAGLALDLAMTALVAQAAASPVSPGANDNASGAGGVVALAELLRARPVAGVRVLLVSCGAEEALQEGARAFAARHAASLDPAVTAFLNLETVGSPRLVLLEGEGPIWMEDYEQPAFRDLVAAAAERAGVPLERGFRARASTDSVVPSRLGYATATLSSLTAWGALANYHQPGDLPAALDLATAADAVRLAREVAAGWAAGA